MLYTAKPLERIYADPSVFDSKRKERPAQENLYQEVTLPNGRIVTRKDGENYVIERLHSTDMRDYLNEEYYPGKNMKQ
jgi:hypothetical protein